MASPQPAVGACPPAQVVANAFVHQYYHILHQSPELVYRFYQDSSKLGRPEAEGLMSSVTTMQAINEKILALDYSEFKAEIKTVDAQESLSGGVLVLVTGYLTGKDDARRNFTQTFFLAPQDKGYYVLNDVFRYMEEAVPHEDGDQGETNDTVAAFAPEQVPENQVTEQTAAWENEEATVEEVYNPSDNDEGSVVEEEMPVPEVVDEIPDDSQMAPNSSANTLLEEAPKKSYASIVKVMKENATPMSAPAPVPQRSAPPVLDRQTVQTSAATTVLPEIPASSITGTESGSPLESDAADGYSIYIKSLPLNATPTQLEEEFRRFGPIKKDGVQVRSNKQQAFCYGFVEFEVASAVQSAIEASPITIGGRQALVEEKRPSGSRVSNRGRFPLGRGGGFRNDRGRGGRGNYWNSRNYGGRGDFGGRGEFINRGVGRGGVSSGRGEGAYNRVNRTVAVNAAEPATPRVSASA